MAVDIDEVLESIGEFGPYQRRIYFLLCLPIIFVGAANLAYVFISATPNYRCYIPECDKPLNEEPIYREPFLNFTIPWNNSTNNYESCYEFRRENINSSSCVEEDFSITRESCQRGFVFDNSIYQATIVTEFNLTCSESWKASVDQSVYFGGMLAGALLFGIISDMFGRRKTILVGIVLMSASGITIALVPTLIMFYVMRFINAMASSGVFQTVFVLGLEFVGPGKRVMFGVVGEYFFALGQVMLALIAYAFSSWRMLQLVISAPVLCFIFYYWVVPESIRWLQAKGRHSKVIATLEEMAKTNKKTIPLHLLRHQIVDNGSIDLDDDFAVLLNNHQKVTVFDLLKSCIMTTRTIFMIIIWITTTLSYYGLSFSASSLQSNAGTSAPYVNFIFCAIAEIPGYTIAWIGMVYCGRKISLTLSLFISAIACGATGFLEDQPTYLLIVFLIGKCFITSAFAIIYVFTAELFPTSLRNTIVGACSMFARIGAMLAPFSTSLKLIYVPLPMMLFGGLSFLSALLTFALPETLNSKLPDTLLEAINIGKRAPVIVHVNASEAGDTNESERLLDNFSESDAEPIS